MLADIFYNEYSKFANKAEDNRREARAYKFRPFYGVTYREDPTIELYDLAELHDTLSNLYWEAFQNAI